MSEGEAVKVFRRLIDRAKALEEFRDFDLKHPEAGVRRHNIFRRLAETETVTEEKPS